MAPKKATTAKPKAAASAPQHASYQDMIKEAILKLKERNGSSRQAIKKYIQANNSLGGTTDAAFTSHLSRAIKTGKDNGIFEQPKGSSGPVKLKKPAAKAEPKTEGATSAKPAAKPKTVKPVKKAGAPKKAAGAKKAAPKKTATKAAAKPKAAPKKAAAKPKANTSKKAAPAVEAKPETILGKTSSGRVTKTVKPKTAVKKVTAKKTAAPKKATPKKATPKKA